MLEQGDGGDLIARLWPATELQAALPEGEEQFFDIAGPLPSQYDSRRAYHRFYLRQRAILMWNNRVLGAYAKDISREGIGFLSPVQLLPHDRAALLLEGGKKLELRAIRCRRQGERAYHVGAAFVDAKTQAEAFDGPLQSVGQAQA